MIPNPSLDCSYAVLNFWPNLSLVVLIKLYFVKKKKEKRVAGLNFFNIEDTAAAVEVKKWSICWKIINS